MMKHNISTVITYVKFLRVGTKKDFEEHRYLYRNLVKIPIDELYWDNQTGTLAIVAPQEWCDFLKGITTDVPGNVSK